MSEAYKMASSEEGSSSSYGIEVEGTGFGFEGRGRGQRMTRGRGSRSRSAGSGRSGSRGRRGSRGRSVSRGRSAEARVAKPDKERLKELWEQRKTQMKDVVQVMEVQRLRDLVLQLIDWEPALVFDLCEEDGGEPAPDPSAAPSSSLTWCKCGNCRDMGADLDNKCCGCLPRNCISLRDEMERLVLDPQVLALGQRYYREMLGRQGQQVENVNKMFRHSAYRNFILWRHGCLGAGVRRVIPSCCVLVIRGRFPSPTGVYTGFVPGRFI